jgi:hypothetical protein
MTSNDMPPKDSDSRLKGYSRQITHPQVRAQQLFCFLCGAKAGFITQDSSKFISPAHVVVTCDRCDYDIIARYGNLPFELIPASLHDAFGYEPEKPDAVV